MPHQFEFDSTNRILRGWFEGRVTDEELKSFYPIAADCVTRTGPRAAITDFSLVSSFEASSQAIRDLANSDPVLPDPSLDRFIVAPSDHIFGMARMFQLQGERTRPNLHVVRTLKDVWNFLRIQETQFKPIKEE